MNRNVGLWIDHRTAVIISLTDGKEEIYSITSDMDKHVRFSGGAQKVTEEDIRDRRFTNHLNSYYDEVAASIHTADSVLLFGPDEAKTEFQKRFESHQADNCQVTVETSDKMTQNQIAEKVRQFFKK